MFNFSKTCLIISTCCIIALQAYTIRQREREERTQPSRSEEAEDSADYELGHLIDMEALGEGDGDSSDEDERREDQRALEPEAEMLPDDFARVESPGVDHMEMKQQQKLPEDAGSERPLKSYKPNRNSSH